MRHLMPFVLLIWTVGCGQQGGSDSETARSHQNTRSADTKPAATGDDPDCCEIDRSKLLTSAAGRADSAVRAWPMFGGSLSRNMVNLVDKNVPTDWCVEEGKLRNVKWVANLGSMSYGGPVVAGGKVYVGTNNANPRDPKIKAKNKAVLLCFQESDGKFLWQAVHDIPNETAFGDTLRYGLISTPAIDGDRLYFVTTPGEVICADAQSGKTLWRYDMRQELKIQPFHCCNCSPLVAGNKVFVVTGNGVDEYGGKAPSPKAPSFIALDKTSGTLAWQSNLPGDRILEGQWSNPSYAVVNGQPQVIFPGGDNWLYAFEPDSGKLIWKFNCDPQPEKNKLRYIIATPVVHDNRVYVGLGVHPDGHPNEAKFSNFLCLDITRRGDVSAVDLDAKNPKNKDSALVWCYGGFILPKPEKGRTVRFGSTISTCAVHDGLVYIAEERGYLHCLDAKTGQKYWEHDFLTSIWASPYWVDGKVYLCHADGEVAIFAHGKQVNLLAKISMEDATHSTSVVANGVLYVMTRAKLYAIAGAN